MTPFFPGQSLQDILKIIQKELEACQVSNSAPEGEKLLCEALGLGWSELKLCPEKLVTEPQASILEDYLKRRTLGEPLAYITNRAYFFDREFYVDSRVLIPRPETEILVEKALATIPEDAPLRIVDLGCGSGCIGLTLASLRPRVHLVMVDKSEDALEVAKQNLTALSIENPVLWVQAEVQEATSLPSSPFDLVVANPPYIPKGDPRLEESVENFEPDLALYSANQGLECIHKWLHWSYHNLRLGGHGFFEFGAGQELKARQFVEALGLQWVQTYKDYQGLPRVLHFRKA